MKRDLNACPVPPGDTDMGQTTAHCACPGCIRWVFFWDTCAGDRTGRILEYWAHAIHLLMGVGRGPDLMAMTW